MDAEELLNGLEGLRSVIPGFLQGAYDDLVNAIRQIYQGVTRSIAPTAPIDSGRTHLTTHAATLDTLHSQLSSNLLTFQTSYQGKGSDAYHTTAALALQHLGTLRDHTNFAIQKHQSISTNLENAQGSQMMLDGVVITLGFTLGSMIVTGGTDSEIAIPAAGGEAAGGAVTAGSLETSMELVGSDLTDLATETLPEAPDLGDITNLPDILDPDIDPDLDPDPDLNPDFDPGDWPWPDDPIPPWLPPLPPDERDDCYEHIQYVKSFFPDVRADVIAYLCCLQPPMTPQQVVQLFQYWTSHGMAQQDIDNMIDRLRNLRMDGSFAQPSRVQIITFLQAHYQDIPDIWQKYKQIGNKPGADFILHDMVIGPDSKYRGSYFQLKWVVSNQNDVQRIEYFGADGKQGADALLFNGSLVDTKNYIWKNQAFLLKMGVPQADIRNQLNRYMTDPNFMGKPVNYVFNSDGGRIPASIQAVFNEFRKKGLKVTVTYWPNPDPPQIVP